MGTSIMAGIYTSPYPSLYQLKKSGIFHTIIHTQSMREFPSKRGRIRQYPQDGFIYHL